MPLTPLLYRPHPLLRNGHLQTLMVGLICGERPAYRAEPITIPLPDGAAKVVHEERGAMIPRHAPLVILIHGLGGDHRSAYLERLAPRLHRMGFAVWRVDLRGCGHGIEHAWRPANAGSSADLAEVVRAAQRHHSQRAIHVVGFSLSGNIVLKFLAEAATGTLAEPVEWERIESAITVAPPINLHHCADNMDRLSRRIYSYYYLKMLGEQVEVRRKKWPQWAAVPRDPKLKTIRQFDARYTAPLCGFRSTDDYYSRSSAAPLLKEIKTKTTILIDRDDPIVTWQSFVDAELNSDSTQLLETRFGGHMGYFGLDERGQSIRWLEYFVAEQLKSFLPE